MTATVTRYSPLRDLMSVNERLNRMFDEAFDARSNNLEYGQWAPAVDLKEEGGQFVLKADMPGMKREDIDIQVENNLLTISGERRFEEDERREDYHRIERAYGKFVRTFTLSTRVKADAITASYKDGILTVEIPKAEESKPKKIAIKD
jgi:HSP20 family protein